MAIIFVIYVNTNHNQELKQYIEKAAIKGNKIIIIPRGNYFVKDSILIDSKFNNTKIIAENNNVKIFSAQTKPVFVIKNVDNFELSGFIFESMPESQSSNIGFYFQAGAPDWINGSTAVWIENSSHVDISKNHINGYWIGIYITTTKDLTDYINVIENKISNCGYWSIAARYLPLSKDSTEKNLQKISFLKNEISGCEQGPVFRNVSGGIIEKNKVLNNIIGIRIEESQFCEIKNNEIGKNLQSGIFIYHNSYYNNIVKNIIYDNNLQAARIQLIARERGCDESFLPGDIERYDKHPDYLFPEYEKLTGDPKDILAYEPEYWPYPTAYDYITPSNRIKNYLDPELNKKFWGLYFSQWGAAGIELRTESSYNLIENNKIFNSSPLNISKGYMMYGIKIDHLMGSADISKFNVIKNNQIENMVEGLILDVNKKHNIEDNNEY
ncbi:MAG: right-handed parallel beta-helix repeat-containing protein [Patescibacteria group bacterium]|nr:right-handed parallel beta-helix repeat-containing protein [Patescibacteria group bacterium]